MQGTDIWSPFQAAKSGNILTRLMADMHVCVGCMYANIHVSHFKSIYILGDNKRLGFTLTVFRAYLQLLVNICL